MPHRPISLAVRAETKRRKTAQTTHIGAAVKTLTLRRKAAVRKTTAEVQTGNPT